jgi:hypothetical protein
MTTLHLADCLQFCDKRDIVLKADKLYSQLGFESKESGERLLKELEDLRNDLAHAQDIITGRWPKIVDLAEEAEQLLQNCESFLDASHSS